MENRSSQSLANAQRLGVTSASGYSGPQLAALLVALLLNLDSNGSFYKGFDKQLELSATDPNLNHAGFQAQLKIISDFYGEGARAHLFEAAHFAIRALLLELQATGTWGNCTGVRQVHLQSVFAVV